MNGSNIAIIAVLAAVVFVAVVRMLKNRGKSCCGSGESVKKVRPVDADAKNYPYHAAAIVEGMVCINCVRRVENAFNSMDGYMAKVDIDANRAEIWGKYPMEDDFIRSVISGAGYTVKQVIR